MEDENIKENTERISRTFFLHVFLKIIKYERQPIQTAVQKETVLALPELRKTTSDLGNGV
jgi:hypothetical protein